MADYRANNRTSKALDAERKRLVEARLAAIEAKKPKYAMGGARGGMAVSPQGSISKFIESQVEAMVRDTAESVGQVSNEYVNQTPIGMLAKPFLGTDILSKAVGSVNAGAGESMRGEVTPMDVINTVSLLPIPAGAGAKAAVIGAKVSVPLAKKFGIPLAENILNRFRITDGLFEPAFAGIGNIGGALARTGAPKGFDTALRTTPQSVGIASRIENSTRNTKGSNINYSSGPDIIGMATQKNYKRWGDYTRTVASRQAKKAGQRYNAKVTAKQVRAWAGDMFNKNSQDRLNAFVDAEDINMGHPLNKKRLDKEPPTHYVYAPLNRAAEKLLSSGKVSRNSLKNGEDYGPIIRFILDNPEDVNSKTLFNVTEGLKEAKTFDEAVDILVANHLVF